MQLKKWLLKTFGDLAMLHWRSHTCLFLFVTMIRGDAHTHAKPTPSKRTHAT